MSATNRGAVREPCDTYITPRATIERLLEKYVLPAGATVLDPCCASGELLTTLHELRPDLRLVGFELREEARADLEALRADGVIVGYEIGAFNELAKQLPNGAVDFIVSNPPYSLAQEFIETAERITKVAIWLLRLNFVGSKRRHALMARTRPGLITLSNRPSFTKGGTDATEYSWMIFGDATWAGRWVPANLNT